MRQDRRHAQPPVTSEGMASIAGFGSEGALFRQHQLVHGAYVLGHTFERELLLCFLLSCTSQRPPILRIIYKFGKDIPQPNIVLNKIEKKKKEVVTKAENNYLSSE